MTSSNSRSPSLKLNPVLDRELRERMRTLKTPVILTIYLLVLTGILWLTYTGETLDDFGFDALSITRAARVGRSVFEWVLLFMTLLIMFLVPGLTAGAIAGERQRQTLIPLQVTLLRPSSILLGKVGAATAFIVLLIIAAMPILAVSHLLGGTRLIQVFGAAAAVIFLAFVVGALSVTCSTLFKRSQAATLVAYGLMLAMLGGTFVLYGAAGIIDDTRGNDRVDPPEALLLLNPIVFLADVAGADQSRGSAPLSGLRDGLELGGSDDDFFPQDFPAEEVFEDEAFALDQPAFPAVPLPVPVEPRGQINVADNGPSIPFWVWSGASMTLLSVAGLIIATIRLRLPAKADR